MNLMCCYYSHGDVITMHDGTTDSFKSDLLKMINFVKIGDNNAS